MRVREYLNFRGKLRGMGWGERNAAIKRVKGDWDRRVGTHRVLEGAEFDSTPALPGLKPDDVIVFDQIADPGTPVVAMPEFELIA